MARNRRGIPKRRTPSRHAPHNEVASKQISQDPAAKVAVIGDVGIDWAFISNQPARAQASLLRPWTQYPATSLFTVPGAAWFFGHMLKAALHAPRYCRTFSATLIPDDLTHATDFRFKGTLAPLPLDVGIPHLLDLRSPGTSIYIVTSAKTRAHLLANDTHLKTLAPRTVIRLTVPGSLPVAGPQVHMHLRSATFGFSGEASAHPGRAIPDQISRRYNFHNVAILPISAAEPRPLLAGQQVMPFLSLYSFSVAGHAPFAVDILTSNKWQPLLPSQPSLTSIRLLDRTVGSIAAPPLFHEVLVLQHQFLGFPQLGGV